MKIDELVGFVRHRGLAVVASSGSSNRPQAALVGVTATDEGEIVFDTSRSSRKYSNMLDNPAVALVVGFDDEITVQAEGLVDVPAGQDLRRCTTPTSLSTRTDGSEPLTPTSSIFACG